MIKMMIVGRRAPRISRAAAQKHLVTVHGPLVVQPPVDAGPMPAGYVQNHVRDGAYPPSADGGRHAIERDLVTELWFDDVDQMRASVQTPYYLRALKPDEPRFVDDPVVERILVREDPVRTGPRGVHKLFVFACASQSGNGDWRGAIDAVAAMASAASSIVANIALPGPFGPPFADIVIEGWFDDRDAAVAALDAAPLDALGDAADPLRSFAVVAEEFPAERLRRLLADQAAA